MQRRDLLKLSPLALAGTVGHVSLLEAQTEAPAAQAAYNVRTYGATGDGKTVDTPAINKAIDAVAAAGGGTLVFPAGTYLCFTIHLKSNVELYLSRGCTILAADSPKPGETTGYNGGTYDAAEPNDPWTPYQDYGHNHWRNSLFYAENQHDFSIIGPGLIFGKGLSHGSERSIAATTTTSLPSSLASATRPSRSRTAATFCCATSACSRAATSRVLATGVDNLTLDNLLIDTDRDGFDIDCCRNVRVSNCTVNSPWDDGICPKSSYALGYARSTENVTIANNFVTGTYELGSVIAGTWKKFADDAQVPRQRPHQVRHRIERRLPQHHHHRQRHRRLARASRSKPPTAPTSKTSPSPATRCATPSTRRSSCASTAATAVPRRRMRPGTLRRIVISNLVSYNSAASTASILSGIPENLIEDVKLSNCFFGHEGLPKTMRTHWARAPGNRCPTGTRFRFRRSKTPTPSCCSFGPTPTHGFFVRHLTQSRNVARRNRARER